MRDNTADGILGTKLSKTEKKRMQNVQFVKIRDGLPNHSVNDLDRL